MPSVVKKMETRSLHNSDMKKLVRILQGTPFPSSSSKENAYHRRTKEYIHSLPRRLRSTHLSLSSATNLCATHKGLDAHLINDTWAWLRHEVDGAIGKFLYPLIMSGALTADQELKVRQLEPVREMWHHDFKIEMSAPPGREPIQCGGQWCYQADQCPGCMLARIGSDEDVLFALFAGMVGRMKDKATGIDILRGIVGVEKVRSKRLRFVRYWVKVSRGGDSMLFEAGELGVKMKRLRHGWKMEQRRLRDAKHSYPTRHSFEGAAAQQIPNSSTHRQCHETKRPVTSVDLGHQRGASLHATDTESIIGIDITEPYQPKEWPPLNIYDSKLGPKPRPNNTEPLSSAALLGFNLPGLRYCDPSNSSGESKSKSTLARPPSIGSDTTVHPESSVSVAQLRPRPLHLHKPPTMPQPSVQDTQARQSRLSRQDSVIGDLPSLPRHWPSTRRPGQPSACSIASTHTISSYNGGCASSRAPTQGTRNIIDPLDSPVYKIPQTQEQLVEKYRAMLAARSEAYSHTFVSDEEDYASTLPPPRPTSMYSSFGNTAFDDNAYEAADEEDLGCGGGDDKEDVGGCSPLQMPKVGMYRQPYVASTAWDDLY